MFLLVFLLAFNVVFGQLDCTVFDPSQLSTATINYNVDGTIDAFIQEFGAIEDFDAKLRVVPQHNTGTLDYYPSDIITIKKDIYDNFVLNIYKDVVSESTISWGLNTSIYPEKSILSISENPVFPYPKQDFDPEIQEYLELTQIADSTPEIISTVNELVSGIDNYLDAVSVISKFVAYFVEYDLDFADPSLKASDIYSIKKGVCGGFSALATSMFRIVGIPARFVSGYAFTNVGEVTCSNFVAHAWVEVYVPGAGWIPVDPTFKEFFWIDAGHVGLYKSNDLSTSLINATASYVSANVVPNKPDFGFEIVDYELSSQVLDFTAVFSHDEVGENDYVLINVTINNTYDGWVLDTLILSKTVEIIMIYNNETVPIVIPPNTVKSFYYIIKTPRDLDPTKVYTHPFVVSLGSGGGQTLQLSVDPNRHVTIVLDDLLDQVLEKRVYSTGFEMSNLMITPQKTSDEPPVLSFDLINTGNTVVGNLRALINYSDIVINERIGNLNIGETKLYEKILTLPDETGLIPVEVKIFYSNHTSSSSTFFSIIGETPFSFSISGAEVWQSANNYPIDLGFSSIPSDFTNGVMTVYVNDEQYSSTNWYFGATQLLIPHDVFDFGENTVRITISYDDSSGANYYTEASLTFNKEVYEDWFTSAVVGIANFFKAITDIFKLLIGLE